MHECRENPGLFLTMEQAPSRKRTVSVTPLLGAGSEGNGPRSSLIKLGPIRILVDCGYNFCQIPFLLVCDYFFHQFISFKSFYTLLLLNKIKTDGIVNSKKRR
jgi:hypothetical protein